MSRSASSAFSTLTQSYFGPRVCSSKERIAGSSSTMRIETRWFSIATSHFLNAPQLCSIATGQFTANGQGGDSWSSGRNVHHYSYVYGERRIYHFGINCNKFREGISVSVP